MKLQLFLSLVLTFLTSLATAAEQQRNIDIFAWPLSASKPQTLAKVSFNSTDASIQSYNAPTVPQDDDIVRVGFYHPSGRWSGIATSASNLAPEKSQKLQLHVRPNGELYHVGFKASSAGGVAKAASKKDGALSVEVVKIRPGPTPQLNKPIVVSEDGTVEGKEPEQTFLQKYWWAIGGFLLLQVVLSGGKGE
ncbi:hypothetical protein CLAFUW4_11095 [Fulvia fulva]|uniref:Uncharacterized protein n=1 Tax=Passalora fulva TaxID=5499 RepID=A0A9Q8PCA5_PASFU|nr:uncharacterized protein CLAFUR5_10138 [Fulvia fulva]KAK4620005.1 hypothetical protein CLAFUR4_11100 [Fulvia fulva]KAK4620327.1 hypothetical protein CLAFUR0_11106 [Fulvia fulva]UJO19834.1 hypothetical protein CLAFUR5_10138 [Fulvia fulva]WPV17170.1 hypothetical protein CLAFUW4_11095 [Fulvia fulva]WPV32179.1 hypothetical protein CLAFUW7_11092 [Fulvia fulva]